jgi:hypothetical protein
MFIGLKGSAILEMCTEVFFATIDEKKQLRLETVSAPPIVSVILHDLMICRLVRTLSCMSG